MVTYNSLKPCTPAHLNKEAVVSVAHEAETVSIITLTGLQVKFAKERTDIKCKCICAQSFGINDILFTMRIRDPSDLQFINWM
jgi:hypothetical protein